MMGKEKQGIKRLVQEIREGTPEEKSIPKGMVFLELWAAVRTQKKIIVSLACLLLVQGAVIGGGIWLVKVTVDQLFENRDQKGVLLLIGALFIATVLKSLLDFLYNWFQNLAISRVRDSLVVKAFRDLIYSPFIFHTQRRDSEKYGWVLKEAAVFGESAFKMFHSWVKQPVTLISTITALLVIDWKLTLFGMIIFPLGFLFILFLKKKVKEFLYERKQLLGMVEEIISEAIYGIRIIKVFNLENREAGNLGSIVDRQRVLNQKNAFYMGLMAPVSEFMGLMGLSVILLAGSQSIFSGAFTTGTFFAFLMSFLNIYRPLKDLSSGFVTYKMAVHSGRKLIILQRHADTERKTDGRVSVRNFQKLRFDRVWFSYSGEPGENDYVLRDASMEIRRGESVLLIGKSGVGKSTLCDMIFRLLIPERGAILVNDIPLDKIESRSYRRMFALCSQDAIVFNRSLLENIKIAVPEASREEVLAAAEAARLSPYIDSLENGLDTNIGDRGAWCSGGERQRIAIARAIVQKPDVLVFDEAMSGLDVETEDMIWQNIRRLLPETTVLAVSHRWHTIHYCSRVMVMSEGQVIEDRDVQSIDNTFEFFRSFLVGRGKHDEEAAISLEP